MPGSAKDSDKKIRLAKKNKSESESAPPAGIPGEYPMLDLCRLIFGIASDLLRSRVALEAEILVLRQQMNVARLNLRQGQPGIPHALIFSGRKIQANLGRVATRERESVFVIARECAPDDNLRDESIHSFFSLLNGLLRGACHRATLLAGPLARNDGQTEGIKHSSSGSRLTACDLMRKS